GRGLDDAPDGLRARAVSGGPRQSPARRPATPRRRAAARLLWGSNYFASQSLARKNFHAGAKPFTRPRRGAASARAVAAASATTVSRTERKSRNRRRPAAVSRQVV